MPEVLWRWDVVYAAETMHASAQVLEHCTPESISAACPVTPCHNLHFFAGFHKHYSNKHQDNHQPSINNISLTICRTSHL